MLIRTLKLAVLLALSVVWVQAALAQTYPPDTRKVPFPDNRRNHWVFKDLKQMKNDGLLVGYPDGLYQPQRPLTRYNIAVSLHTTYVKLKKMYDDLDRQIKSLSAALDGKGDKADLQKLRDDLTALQEDVKGMKAWGDDIANLRKLIHTFEKDLVGLGVDVEPIKRDLSDMLDTPGDRAPHFIDIYGTFDQVTLAGYRRNSRPGITVDGRQTGVRGASDLGDPLGLGLDLSAMHEATLSFRTTNAEGPNANATLVFGNMLGFDYRSPGSLGGDGFGTQGTTPSQPFHQACQSLYILNLSGTYEGSIHDRPFRIEAGRMSYKVAPYIFQRPDTTPYFANDRWDDGKWLYDGAFLGINLGPARVMAFGGQTNTATSLLDDSQVVQTLRVGRSGSPWDGANRPLGLQDDNQLGMKVDNLFGLQVVTPDTGKAQLSLAYVTLGSNKGMSLTDGGRFNRLSVYGGDLKMNFDPVTLDGGYSATILQYNQHNVIDSENAAWWVNAGYKANKWGVKAGYRNIGTNFAAPGDWGRIGMWWNPVDIKGFNTAANLNINDKATLKASGEWYTGINDSVSDWGSNQKVDRYTAELGYKISPIWDLMMGYEHVLYRLGVGIPQPEEVWYTLGSNYNFSEKAKLSVLWQISDSKRKGADPFTIGATEKHTGGLITTQLSMKF